MSRPRVATLAMWTAILLTAAAVVLLIIRFAQLADESEELRGDVRGAEALRNSIARRAQALEEQVRDLGETPVVTVPAPSELPTLAPAAPAAPPARDDPERQERERQEAERQQRERQQDERQEAERQEREFQNPDVNDLEAQEQEEQETEAQDDEVQDPEEQEPEVQEAEEQEPETQEEEIQDAERDDPDPNSALEFAVDDQCDPAEGEFVTDVSASWQRSPGTVTLVLTCTSAAVPAGIQP